MKYLAIFMTCAALLFCLACNSSSGLLSSADAEAQAQAQQFVEAQLTRCGDSYYGIRRLAHDNTLYQFKNPKITVKSRALTHADQLNGIEWKGESTFRSEVWRTYDERSGWSPWEQVFMTVDIGLSEELYKEKGQWKFGSTGDFTPHSFEKIDCAKVPQ